MDLDALTQALAESPFAGKIHHYATIASTNTEAMRQAMRQASADAATWSVYVADEQTAGRGRGAHAWYSSPGEGLYFSVVLRPNLSMADALWLSLAAGLAAHDAITKVTGVKPDLRWPNDLMIAGSGGSKKVGGILIETQTEGTRLRHAVVGIGVNVNHAGFPGQFAEIATSLQLATGQSHSREELLAEMLRCLHAEVVRLESTWPPDAAIAPRLEAASTWVRGKAVRVMDYGNAAHNYTGTTAGLDARGFLLVKTAEGLRTVVSGGVREAGGN
jgi:BirA family transcriptional regulator, biotin operon repressor / biotin---[acetyl-CoA-carboxylase] ligase